MMLLIMLLVLVVTSIVGVVNASTSITSITASPFVLVKKYRESECALLTNEVSGDELLLKCWPTVNTTLLDEVIKNPPRYPIDTYGRQFYFMSPGEHNPAIDYSDVGLPDDIVQGGTYTDTDSFVGPCVWFCALIKASSQVRCWGVDRNNTSSFLLMRNNKLSEAPVVFDFSDDSRSIKMIATNGQYQSVHQSYRGSVVCALLDSNEIVCDGRWSGGRWEGKTPFRVSADLQQTIKEIAITAFGGCALFEDGDVRCWGIWDATTSASWFEFREPYTFEFGTDALQVKYDEGYKAVALRTGLAQACLWLTKNGDADDHLFKCFGFNIGAALGFWVAHDPNPMRIWTYDGVMNINETYPVTYKPPKDDLKPVGMQLFGTSGCVLRSNSGGSVQMYCWGDEGVHVTFEQGVVSESCTRGYHQYGDPWGCDIPFNSTVQWDRVELTGWPCITTSSGTLACSGVRTDSESSSIMQTGRGYLDVNFGARCADGLDHIDGKCQSCSEARFGVGCTNFVKCKNGECPKDVCYGTFGNGLCTSCDEGYFGASCDTQVPCKEGRCDSELCQGLTGDGQCDECNDGWWGLHCDQQVTCNLDGGTCSIDGGCKGLLGNGHCVACLPGYAGRDCLPVRCNMGPDMECVRDSLTGTDLCASESNQGGVCVVGTCSGVNQVGRCTSCNPGYYGWYCEQRCDTTTQTCVSGVCEGVDGQGVCTGCQQGYFGGGCSPVLCNTRNGVCAEDSCWGVNGNGHCTACISGFYGEDCMREVECDTNNGVCTPGRCSDTTGSGQCDACRDGATGPYCTPTTGEGSNRGDMVIIASVAVVGVLGVAALGMVTMYSKSAKGREWTLGRASDMLSSNPSVDVSIAVAKEYDGAANGA